MGTGLAQEGEYHVFYLMKITFTITCVCVFMFVSHETRKGIMRKEEEIQEVGNGRLQEIIGED